MHVIRALDTLRDTISDLRNKPLSMGFVPTMGALHAGHLKLIERSKGENEVTIASIFVNPLQFDNPSDLNAYPRAIEEDLEELENFAVDYVFIPNESEFYSTKPVVSINFGGLSERLEGKYRKGHFEGVGVVVSKFLHLIDPDNAYFGLKDLQQFILIRRMCEDLSFRCEIVGVDTVREKSGLALSSRNRRLSKDGLEVATILNQVLLKVKNDIQNQKPLNTSIEEAYQICSHKVGFELEYLEVVDPRDLSNVKDYSSMNELAVCIAGYVEGVRLIDNLYLRFK